MKGDLMFSNFLEEMDYLWERYFKKMNDKDYLIKDGIDPDRAEQYFSQKTKVLFVLKESNEEGVSSKDRKIESKSIYDENGWFTTYRRDRAMITKMIKMYCYICDIKEGIDTPTKSKTVNAQDRYSFAFININKHGNGGEKCNFDELKKHFEKDAGLLSEQINLLNPDVIVFGVKDLKALFDKKIKLNNEQVKTIVTPHFKRMGYAVFEDEVRRKYGLTE